MTFEIQGPDDNNHVGSVMGLREKIAEFLWNEYGDDRPDAADRILAIPEIASATEARRAVK